MKKLVTCKTCGATIAKTARTCPSCGAKQHQGAYIAIGIITAVMIIAVIGILFGEEDAKPTLVEKEPPASSMQNSESKAEPQAETPSVFGVGETANLNDIHVTLTSVSQGNGKEYMRPKDGNVFIFCEFEIENHSDRDIAVSSLVSFEGYVDEYSTNLSVTAMLASGKDQPDGTIAAGKKMTGVVGYEADAGWKTVEVRFTPNFWSGKDITFTYSK